MRQVFCQAGSECGFGGPSGLVSFRGDAPNLTVTDVLIAASKNVTLVSSSLRLRWAGGSATASQQIT